MSSTTKVTSTEIKIALSQWKQDDFFLTEVKNGSTYFPPAQGLLIFDGVGIRKSYSKPCITMYEIKVSRGDFLQDNKWNLYRQYCNEFYFVVPKGLIDKKELPSDCGLIYYNPETKKLLTKQKSQYKECDQPYEMYQYIIYSRLASDHIPFYEEKAEYAKDYIADKADKRNIGYALRTKMAKEMTEMSQRLESLKSTEKKVKFFDDVVKLLRNHGGWYSWRDDPEEILKELEKRMSQGCNPDDLDRIEINAKDILRRIEALRPKDPSEDINLE